MPTPRRLRVLWLCSWYPSAVDAFVGDFIQRHARAVSRFVDVQVLYAVGSSVSRGTVPRSASIVPGLSEDICIYPTTHHVQKVLSPFRWWIQMLRMFRQYHRTVGLPDIVHVQVPFKSGLLARYLCFRYGIKYVVTEHYGIYNDRVSDRFAKRSLIFRGISRLAYQGAVRSISVSAYQLTQLEYYFGKKPGSVVHNAVDTALFFPGEFVERPFTFIHVSELTENKNPTGIIHAFNRLRPAFPDIRLIVVGSLIHQAALSKQRDELSGRGIRLVGELAYAGVAEQLQHADCLVLFSYMENAPCVIGEALCSGLQVIASDVGGVPELIDPSCSILIPAGDEEALYQAMCAAINRKANMDPRAIASKAQAKFAYEVVGSQLHQAYLDVLSERTEA